MSLPRIRVGQGIDVHQLVEGRPLVLGGVTIEHTHGLLGHSDADVLLHAVADAVLGALGKGDIGVFFPDTDSRWKGADSLELLRIVWESAKADGWQLMNADCTVVIERPKIRPFIPAMQEKIAGVLGASVEQISIKATTSETLGYVGRREGATAYAVVLLGQAQ